MNDDNRKQQSEPEFLVSKLKVSEAANEKENFPQGAAAASIQAEEGMSNKEPELSTSEQTPSDKPAEDGIVAVP